MEESDKAHPHKMPHKPDEDNFMLSEFWYTVEKGTDKDHTATSVEKFEGNTKNQDQALGLQGLSVNVDAVVAAYNKAIKGCNGSVIKLQRAVSSAEPVQVTLRKRKSPGLAPFQKGFEACKRLVTETYEVLEDQRGLKKTEVGGARPRGRHQSPQPADRGLQRGCRSLASVDPSEHVCRRAGQGRGRAGRGARGRRSAAGGAGSLSWNPVSGLSCTCPYT